MVPQPGSWKEEEEVGEEEGKSVWKSDFLLLLTTLIFFPRRGFSLFEVQKDAYSERKKIKYCVLK